MQIRPLMAADLERMRDIDGTIESTQYVHLECAGEGLCLNWRLEPRPLREKMIEPNPLDDERTFLIKQIATGTDEGFAVIVEAGDAPAALLVAQPRPQTGTLRIIDLRVDYDYRRQGLGTALLYQAMQDARTRGLRAVSAEVRTNNLPANELLRKCGFRLAGLDTHRHSNHDLVKETATLFWYATMD